MPFQEIFLVIIFSLLAMWKKNDFGCTKWRRCIISDLILHTCSKDTPHCIPWHPIESHGIPWSGMQHTTAIPAIHPHCHPEG